MTMRTGPDSGTWYVLSAAVMPNYVTLELFRVDSVLDCKTTTVHGVQNWKSKTVRNEMIGNC